MTNKPQEMNFEEFGKSIWDAAMNAHVNGCRDVIVPFKLPDGGISRVTVSPPRYTETMLFIEDDGPVTKWRHGLKMSDGSIKWGEWE